MMRKGVHGLFMTSLLVDHEAVENAVIARDPRPDLPREARSGLSERGLRIAGILAAVVIAHAGIIAVLNTFELAPVDKNGATEIPIELVSAPEAEEKPEAKQSADAKAGVETKGHENPAGGKDISAEAHPKPEKTNPEPPKTEPSQPDERKSEQTKPEQSKPEEPKPEEPKPESPKPEPPKAEQPKPEPPKPEPPKQEAKPEPPKPEPPKPTPPKAEPAKPEPRKAAALKKEVEKPAPKTLEPPRQEQAAKAPPPPPLPPQTPQQQVPAPLGQTLQAQTLQAQTLQAMQHALAERAPPPPDPNARTLPDTFDFVPNTFKAAAMPQAENYGVVPQASDYGEDLVSYSTLVFSRLEESKKYPKSALQRGVQGAAGIGFTLDDDGHVLDVELLVSSGDADLDAESIALVRRAEPFPPPPKGAQHRFDAVVTFSHR